MRAIVYHEYGSADVLRQVELEKPVPADDEVLLRIRAASVNPLDWHFMRGSPYLLRVVTGLRHPKNPRLGVDVAGTVEAVGRNITQFQPGDAVFGACRGAFAEYGCAREQALVRKPENLTFEEAAAVNVAGITALQALRDHGRVDTGEEVLINGAAGGVGTFAVQIARSFGADVTGVCSIGNVEMVRSLGAIRVIDYTQEDFTRTGKRYDLILDAIGNHPLSACRRALKPGGSCVMVGGADSGLFGMLLDIIKPVFYSRVVSQSFVTMLAKPRQEDLKLLSELMESGQVRPVIDRCYRLSETAEAIWYLEAGHARGKVVITCP